MKDDMMGATGWTEMLNIYDNLIDPGEKRAARRDSAHAYPPREPIRLRDHRRS